MHKGIKYSLAVFRVMFNILYALFVYPFIVLFRPLFKNRISNSKNWKMSKKDNLYYKIRKGFVVICYYDDRETKTEIDEDGEEDVIATYFKLLIKKDGDDYYVNNKFEDEEQTIKNAYSALKQLKLI